MFQLYDMMHTLFMCLSRFIKSADKLYKNAEESELLGDEEKAYVMYMKYFNIISAIKNTVEYKKNHVRRCNST